MRPHHLKRYAVLFNHVEQRELLVAWLRDNLHPEMLRHVLNATGDDLSRAVKEWVPPTEDEDKRMLAWWAREMARDGELQELFKLLSARAGYRGEKRRPRGRGTGAARLLCFAFACALALAPAPATHTRQGRAATLALGRRQCFLLAAAQAA